MACPSSPINPLQDVPSVQIGRMLTREGKACYAEKDILRSSIVWKIS
jgi:hypothetical protein